MADWSPAWTNGSIWAYQRCATDLYNAFNERRALFAEIQRLAADDLPSLPLFFRVDPFVIPKALKGVTPTGTLNSSTLWVEQWRWEN